MQRQRCGEAIDYCKTVVGVPTRVSARSPTTKSVNYGLAKASVVAKPI